MRSNFFAVYFLTFFLGCGSLTRYISHIQNFVNLVSAYNLDGFSTIDFPPLADVSQAMVVNIDLHLYAINGFDEVAGNIELVVALEMEWLDEMSIIQSISFKIEDRAEFLVPYDMIWTPKIVLTNAIGATSGVGESAYLCRFDMESKRINWKPRVVVSGSCTPDVTYYPFDKQECDFIYTAWGFKSDEILLTSSMTAWNFGEYGESGEWDIDSTSTHTYILNDQSYIKFTIVMVRKPLYFAFNILLPILVLCLLNSTVFLLPAESGERVGFSVTCFLSFMVLLNMIMDIMPRSSNPISFLCYYLVVMMSNSGAMTLVTILLMRVYHKPEKSEVPKWMQRAVTFVNCGCAKLRCCVLCCRYLRNKCCCEDQRKCGCKRRKKTMSEELLTEITVDKDHNIIEKPVKKKKLKAANDEEAEKSRKCCCFLSCVKKDDNSNSICCCGCILGCRKCKNTREKNKESTDSSNSEAEKDSRSLPCFSCFRDRKRKIGDEKIEINCENDESSKKKIKSEHDVISNKGSMSTCMGFLNRTENGQKSANEESEENGNCFAIKFSRNVDDSKTIITTCPSCFGRKDEQVKSLNKSRGCSNGCFSYFQGSRGKEKSKTDDSIDKKSFNIEESETKEDSNNRCFGFMRKTKVSTLETTNPDIENDVMPVSKRSEDTKTLKVTFKGKENLDTEETLLQRWEDATKGTANKKGGSLTPINKEESNEDEVISNVTENDEEMDVTLKTKSIRASIKESKAKEKAELEKDKENSDVEIEIVRKTRPRRASIKEKLPKPVVREKVNVPVSRRASRVSKLDPFSDDDSEESDVDSLADLEEEVSWPEVGRILDTFFFLAFAGGQAFLTVVFLVPLFTGDTKNSET